MGRFEVLVVNPASGAAASVIVLTAGDSLNPNLPRIYISTKC